MNRMMPQALLVWAMAGCSLTSKGKALAIRWS